MKSPNYLHLFLVALIALIVFAPQAMLAGQPVDPSTLNPPPPPEFNPVCEKDGNQTICTVQLPAFRWRQWRNLRNRAQCL